MIPLKAGVWVNTLGEYYSVLKGKNTDMGKTIGQYVWKQTREMVRGRERDLGEAYGVIILVGC